MHSICIMFTDNGLDKYCGAYGCQEAVNTDEVLPILKNMRYL